MNAVIAERVRANPGLIETAKEHLSRWMQKERKDGRFNSKVLLEWEKILEQSSADEIVTLLLSETERADWLRSSSPICGMLSEEERMAIIKAHAPVTA